MDRKLKRIARLIVVLCCATISVPAGAQIVSDAAGTIDLKLYPFFDTKPVWSEEENQNIWVPDEGLHEVISVGLSDVSVSIDGRGSYSSKGLSAFDYEYMPIGISEAWFNFHVFADTFDAGDGAGGSASLQLQITFSQSVYYRFEADVINAPVLYEVSFNGQQANAWYSAMGEYDGSFPPTYHYDNPMPDGWDTYVDEGILPAGTYQLSVAAYASLSRYGGGRNSEGSANLHIRLLGDADLDGVVDIEDLNIVLSHWNSLVPQGVWQFGDLDGNGFVNILDLNMVLAGWNQDARPQAVAVPQPGGVVLWIILGPILCRRRTPMRH